MPYRLTRKVSLSVGAAGSAGAADWAGTDVPAGAARVACTDGPAGAGVAGANRELRLESSDQPRPGPACCLWAAHPQFVAGPDTQILLPDEINEVCNVLPSERMGSGRHEVRLARSSRSHGESVATRSCRTRGGAGLPEVLRAARAAGGPCRS